MLGCVDSSVPPEVVFDAGWGELFAIRVAGNVFGPANDRQSSGVSWYCVCIHLPFFRT
jgi:carbonic anhydrase